MNDITAEVFRASELLRRIEPPSGAKHRVYQRIVRPTPKRRPVRLQLVIVGVATLIAAGTAEYTLKAVIYPRPTVTVVKPTADRDPKQADKRKVRSKPLQPATPATEASSVPEPSAVPQTAEPKAVVVAAESRGVLRSPAASEIAVAKQTGATRRSLQAPAPDSSIGTEQLRESQPDPAHDSDLSSQIAEYRTAVALVPSDPSLALDRLRRFRQSWPKSVIAHEVDLKIVATLLALGRRDEATSEAKVFLRHYPNSPRIDEMHRLTDPSSVE